MKRPFRIGVLVLGVIALLVVGGAWLSWRLEVRRLRSPLSVVEETGLRLAKSYALAASENLTHLVRLHGAADMLAIGRIRS